MKKRINLLGTHSSGYILDMPDVSFLGQYLSHLKNQVVHLVGAKGTGMCALAEILIQRGAIVRGSDTDEIFYTDAILQEIGVPVTAFESGLPANDITLVIQSAAYDNSNPVIAAAMERGLPIFTYPQVLGAFSALNNAYAIAGVHGKTTTTAMTGSLVKALNLPATVIVGSAVTDFGNRSTWTGGHAHLIAETCEYRRHFLNFQPNHILLTGVESDHQDYFPDYNSIRDAFVEFVLSLPHSGSLIYCHDDAGAREVMAIIAGQRPDICMIPYGESASGPWQIEFSPVQNGINGFRVAAFDKDFQLKIPGRHLALDATAALALVHSIHQEFDCSLAQRTLVNFQGSRRRSEIIGEVHDILVMDDYAHHPTAIATTLLGLKKFHSNRRLLVDFMPHTFSRTAALLEDFAQCFSQADIVGFHPIYASARENFNGNITGQDLANKAAERRGSKMTVFHNDFHVALQYWKQVLQPGDLFITLGAGNNWTIGRQVFEDLQK